MAANIRAPDGRDLDVVFAARITDPTGSNTNLRGPDGSDLRNRYEKTNSAGTAPSTNIRNPSGNDLNTMFTTVAEQAVSKDFSAWGQEPNNSGSSWGQARFNRDGWTQQVSGASSTGESSVNDNWNVSHAGDVGDRFEILFNENTGSITGPFGSWYRLNDPRVVAVNRNTIGTSNGQCRWWIRRVGQADAHATGMIYLSATVGSV